MFPDIFFLIKTINNCTLCLHTGLSCILLCCQPLCDLSLLLLKSKENHPINSILSNLICKKVLASPRMLMTLEWKSTKKRYQITCKLEKGKGLIFLNSYHAGNTSNKESKLFWSSARLVPQLDFCCFSRLFVTLCADAVSSTGGRQIAIQEISACLCGRKIFLPRLGGHWLLSSSSVEGGKIWVCFLCYFCGCFPPCKIILGIFTLVGVRDFFFFLVKFSGTFQSNLSCSSYTFNSRS